MSTACFRCNELGYCPQRTDLYDIERRTPHPPLRGPLLMRTLGAACTPTAAFLALAVDGVIQPGPDRLEWPAREESERLGVLLNDMRGLLVEQRVDQVALLLPERAGQSGSGLRSSYYQVAPRVMIETIIRLAAVMNQLPVAMLDRRSVRSRLDCGVTGKLESYVERVIPAAPGRYWRAGRGLAALAALAMERS